MVLLSLGGSGPCYIEEEVQLDPSMMTQPLQCDGKMAEPEHVNVDFSGRLWEVDRGNLRIQVFSPSQSRPQPTSEQGEEDKIVTKMAGSEQVPFIETTGSGFAEFQPFREQQKIKYSLNVTDIEQVTSAYLHTAEENKTGPIVLTLFTSEAPQDFKRETGILEDGKNVTAPDLEGPMAGKEISDLISAR